MNVEPFREKDPEFVEKNFAGIGRRGKPSQTPKFSPSFRTNLPFPWLVPA